MKSKKLKRTGIGLGIGLAALLNEGCATPEGNAAMSALLGIASTPSPTDTDFDKIGKFGAGLGSVYTGAMAQRQMIESGAPRVNVNVGHGNYPNQVGSYNYTPIGFPPSEEFINDVNNRRIRYFTCNWVNDSNGNGRIDGNEFYGVKNVFKRGEPISIIGILYERRGTPINLLVKNSSGKIIESKNDVCDRSGTLFDLTTNGDIGTGKFVSEYYTKGKYIGGTTFFIGD